MVRVAMPVCVVMLVVVVVAAVVVMVTVMTVVVLALGVGPDPSLISFTISPLLLLVLLLELRICGVLWFPLTLPIFCGLLDPPAPHPPSLDAWEAFVGHRRWFRRFGWVAVVAVGRCATEEAAAVANAHTWHEAETTPERATNPRGR